MKVRIGLPDVRPDYVNAARRLGAPLLLSASAFARRWTEDMKGDDQAHPGFRPPVAGRLDGMDVALDSAGFTAMSQYGDFPWTVEQYIELAAAHPWTWWSSMDLCCEPQVAGDRAEVHARTMRTAWYYDRLCELADDRGIPRPMPVIQGFDPHDYLVSFESLTLPDDVSLVGIGSVCRRQVHGPDGLVAVIDRLDRVLPKHIRFHLFGVKSDALSLFSGCERICSMDSMAWALSARRETPVGRNNQVCIDHMERFWARQHGALQARAPVAMALELPPRPAYASLDAAQRTRIAEVLLAIRNGDADMLTWHQFRLMSDLATDIGSPAKALGDAEVRAAQDQAHLLDTPERMAA